MALDRAEFEARFTAMLRDEVRAKWEQSGRDFGRAEPPPPTLRIDRFGRGEIQVRLEQIEGMAWEFLWDGSEVMLVDWIETVAEDYWSDYVDPGYKSWQPPQ